MLHNYRLTGWWAVLVLPAGAVDLTHWFGGSRVRRQPRTLEEPASR